MSVGPNAALAVGATLGLNTYVGGPFGGGSMNPWRSFAPGILSSHYRGYLWIYCIAPFCSTWLVALTLIMFRGWKVGEETITMATGEGMANV